MKCAAWLLLIPLAVTAAPTEWVTLPGGSFRSALQYEDSSNVRIAPLKLMETPVSTKLHRTHRDLDLVKLEVVVCVCASKLSGSGLPLGPSGLT